MNINELKNQLTIRDQELKKDKHYRLRLRNSEFTNLDLSNFDLSHIDFSWSTFTNVNLDGANLSYCYLNNASFPESNLRNAIIKNSIMVACNMRFCDLSGADISSTNIFRTLFEYAKLNDIKYDENTKYFKLYPPEKGAFIAYKTCMDNKLVKLLVPADARRSSATANSCRCDKAKVLKIMSRDGKKSYTDGQSFVDENFIYKVGELMVAKNFNPDRWMDSTGGIHFWMTKEEALAYM